MTTRRKLAAILAADAVGYSRLMADDEAATLRSLNDARALFRDRIEGHGGRLIDTAGDSVLAEFISPVEAVNAAVEIQRELAERNVQLAEQRRMQFRIGTNLGDVIEQEDGTIYGDGVNVAARLQALAEPGGICISGTVFEQVEGKLPLQFKFLGEQQVKNIPRSVRAYRVLAQAGPATHRMTRAKRSARLWRNAVVATATVLVIALGVGAARYLTSRATAPESAPAERLPRPDRPSIAVLPFANMSGDPKQEYFADGITETMITDLSKIYDLKVIARNSSFTYKGKPVDVRRVSQELGVRYVLEGSVQQAGGRVRLNAQLIDAATGNHLWAERFDRELKDLFAVQDEITRQIVTELDVKLVAGEDARIWRKTLTNVKAYQYYLRGQEQRFIMSPESNAQARAFHEQAVSLDPGFAIAYSGLAWAHFNDANFYWSDNREISTQKALKAANEALRLDPDLPDAYSVLGMIHLLLLGDYDKGVNYGKKAVAVQPNGANASAVLGSLLTRAGEPQSALRYLEKAVVLNPFPEPWYDFELGVANQLTGHLDKAIGHFEAAIHKTPKWVLLRLHAVDAYIEAGRQHDAQREIDAILQLDPGISVEKASRFENWKRPGDGERYLNNLRKAGLK